MGVRGRESARDREILRDLAPVRRRVGFTSGFQHSALGSVTLWCFNIVSRRRKGEYRMNNGFERRAGARFLDLVLVGI